MSVRATARLPTAIVVTAAALLGAVLIGVSAAAMLATPWLVLLVLGLREPLPTDPSIESAVSTERAMVGDTVVLTATVTAPNRTHVSLIPRWRRPSRTGDQDRVDQNGAAIWSGSRGEPNEAVFEMPFTEWGAWQLASYDVGVANPHRLFEARATVPGSVGVRVHPESIDLRRLVAPRFLRRSTGRHTSRLAGRGIEFADIRPFTSGDQVRDINWTASARRAELQVSERHPERACDVVLLIDTLVEPGHDIERVLSLSINAALAAGSGHLGLTDRVGLVEFGGIVRWLAPGTGARHLHRLTDALLASVTFANASEKALPLLAPSVWPPRSLVLAITPLLDERFVEALFEARRRGHDVAVIHIDTLDAHDAGIESDVQSVARRLVRAEQRRLRGELADHGVAATVWRRDEPVESPLMALARARRG